MINVFQHLDIPRGKIQEDWAKKWAIIYPVNFWLYLGMGRSKFLKNITIPLIIFSPFYSCVLGESIHNVGHLGSQVFSTVHPWYIVSTKFQWYRGPLKFILTKYMEVISSSLHLYFNVDYWSFLVDTNFIL